MACGRNARAAPLERIVVGAGAGRKSEWIRLLRRVVFYYLVETQATYIIVMNHARRTDCTCCARIVKSRLNVRLDFLPALIVHRQSNVIEEKTVRKLEFVKVRRGFNRIVASSCDMNAAIG